MNYRAVLLPSCAMDAHGDADLVIQDEGEDTAVQAEGVQADGPPNLDILMRTAVQDNLSCPAGSTIHTRLCLQDVNR